MLPQNYMQHTSPNTSSSDHNNNITPPVNDQTTNYLVKSDTTIMLQIAYAYVMNKPEDQI